MGSPEMLGAGGVACRLRWTSRPSRPYVEAVDTLVIIAVISGSKGQDRWGFACVVSTTNGCMLKLYVAWMDCTFVSSKLLEATAMTEGTMAVLRRLKDLPVEPMLLIVGADNKQAVGKLAACELTYWGGDLMDRVVSECMHAAL